MLRARYVFLNGADMPSEGQKLPAGQGDIAELPGGQNVPMTQSWLQVALKEATINGEYDPPGQKLGPTSLEGQ